ncbi:hypothetical protein GCM10022263_13470 [Nocardioides daeguensis]|uniref:DUF5671 domain-containing protein n=1 Tax=Nocardioides daeguensis TaxID=908359 RepID=A0ABP6V0R4_9ACTN
MIGAVILLLVVGVVVTAIVAGARRATHRAPAPGTGESHAVRQLFEYLLLFGLLVASAVGVSGLLAAVFAQGSTVAVTDSEIARSIAFTVVGVPLCVALAVAVRRGFARDETERDALPWVFYLSGTSLVSLVGALFALHDSIAWALDLRPFDPQPLAQAPVWTAVWAGHWWLGTRQRDRRPLQLHLLAGSLVGLALGLVGLGGMLSGALRIWLGLDGDVLLAGANEPVLAGAITFLLGGATWVRYWLFGALRSERNALWHAYQLLAGETAGLVVSLVAASIALDRALVWLVGDPWSTDAHRYFQSMPATLASTTVGLLALLYHRAVLTTTAQPTRTEVDRIRDYLLAAVGLGASSAGATIVVVALIEAVTDPSVIAGSGALNTLIAALTLLGVGGPVWWLHWRRGQRATPAEETVSPTRRLYLFLLLGLASLASVGALLAGAWILVDRILQEEPAAEVMRSVRFPIGILVTAGAVAAYHWAAYRTDRAHLPPPAAPQGCTFALLLGVADEQTAAETARRTGAAVWIWAREDVAPVVWAVEDIIAAIEAASVREVVVLAEEGALRTIPVNRRGVRPAAAPSVGPLPSSHAAHSPEATA